MVIYRTVKSLDPVEKVLKLSTSKAFYTADIKNRLNAIVSVSENCVIWIDFSISEINVNIRDTRFTRKASQEIRN
jgi:hypothetical protein